LEYIAIAILVALVIAAIAYPLFFSPRADLPGTTDQLEELAAQRDATYDAIRDLDYDYQLGKLSAPDHASLREKYMARAALVLKQIDAEIPSGEATSAGDQLEAQVAQLRHKRTDAVEVQVARLRVGRKSAKSACGHCGTPFLPGDRFCAKCGQALPRNASRSTPA
jgi:hypothetical protein